MDKAALKNYNQEAFPERIDQLIAKCEQTIVAITERFANPNCLVVKDLYSNTTSKRCEDFLEKLQVVYNTDSDDKIKNEVRGLYVFGSFENGKVVPVYVGISRTVLRRLRQHVWGNKHNEATLAYLKAKMRLGHGKGRADLDETEFKPEQEIIKDYRLVVIPETNYYDLYFMEVYIAGRLKTHWNSFRTH